MQRQIIKIDEEKCNGCGLCVTACHEGAIGLVDGRARLLRDDYCDGLGDCLPACPAGAIELEKREAVAYNEEEVRKRMEGQSLPCGCPGALSMEIRRPAGNVSESVETGQKNHETQTVSQLRQWPVQIKLVPVTAPYFEGAGLLIAADCTAFAYPDIHGFMRNKITLTGCPKLDSVDYSEKLGEILSKNNIKSITLLRMEVPCCGGIVNAVKNALQYSGKIIPWSVVTISTGGNIIED